MRSENLITSNLTKYVYSLIWEINLIEFNISQNIWTTSPAACGQKQREFDQNQSTCVQFCNERSHHLFYRYSEKGWTGKQWRWKSPLLRIISYFLDSYNKIPLIISDAPCEFDTFDGRFHTQGAEFESDAFDLQHKCWRKIPVSMTNMTNCHRHRYIFVMQNEPHFDDVCLSFQFVLHNRYAMTFRLTVIRSAWVYNAWEQRDDVEFKAKNKTFTDEHRLKAFEGQRICFFGFASDEHQHMIDVLKMNGGATTNLDDPDCTHVVSLDHLIIFITHLNRTLNWIMNTQSNSICMKNCNTFAFDVCLYLCFIVFSYRVLV